jgi:hypothetical protein
MGLLNFFKKQMKLLRNSRRYKIDKPRDRYGRTPMMNAALAGDWVPPYYSYRLV